MGYSNTASTPLNSDTHKNPLAEAFLQAWLPASFRMLLVPLTRVS